jgi:hypothetical protein
MNDGMQKLIFCWLLFLISIGINAQTFAERLGFPKGAKVLIMHVDDAGMSYDSNLGAITALKEGVATSTSVMMPCPWVPAFITFIKANPETDAGLHLTLTSEWEHYRWGPVSGTASLSLIDNEGAFWPSVDDVVKYATVEDVKRELKSQLDKALKMGFSPTHLDSHMGTLFAKPEFLESYIRLGIEHKIPVMFPGGHNTMIRKQVKDSGINPQQVAVIANLLWDAGLPVLDDLHNISYDWHYPNIQEMSEEVLQKAHTRNYIESFADLKPGITMVIMHCTATSEIFEHISDSGPIRKADMLAMLSPELKNYIQENGIILTTWRDLMNRRKNVMD